MDLVLFSTYKMNTNGAILYIAIDSIICTVKMFGYIMGQRTFLVFGDYCYINFDPLTWMSGSASMSIALPLRLQQDA